MELRVTRVRKVFSDGRHNAFTGLANHAGRTFLTFRSGTNHGSYDGRIKVIASTDLATWRPVMDQGPAWGDYRDPKLAALPNALVVCCGAYLPDQRAVSLTAVAPAGDDFGPLTPAAGVPVEWWLWDMQAHAGVLYGTAYSGYEANSHPRLLRSADGRNWEQLATFPVPGSETAISFDHDGRLWALLRDDAFGSVPTLCSAPPPYTKFDRIVRPPIRLQGPRIKRLDGACVIIGRRWDNPGRRNLRTEVLLWEDGRDVVPVRWLPSGGDTSYAAWLDREPGLAVVSYYSSHEHKMDEPHAADDRFRADEAYAEHSTAADIFLADVSYRG